MGLHSVADAASCTATCTRWLSMPKLCSVDCRLAIAVRLTSHTLAVQVGFACKQAHSEGYSVLPNRREQGQLF